MLQCLESLVGRRRMTRRHAGYGTAADEVMAMGRCPAPVLRHVAARLGRQPFANARRPTRYSIERTNPHLVGDS